MYRVMTLILSLCSLTLFGGEIENAAQENKHLFIFFYKEQNEKTAAMQKIFDQAMQKLNEKSMKAAAGDPLVNKFNLKRAPMPFVIVLAPNGAITGGFASFTEEQLIDAVTTPGAASCLKALQDRKLVLLCLNSSEAAMKGVKEFKADPCYGSAAEIVTIDPAKEQKFLHQLSLDTHSTEALTVLIAPPANIVGTYRGATNKAQMVEDLQKASSGCCCPGGCCK
jgi:hypothetical protein